MAKAKMPSAHSIIFRLLLVALLASTAEARKPEPSRLVRTLSGTSEKAKLRELQELANQPKQREAALADLCEAATAVAEKAAKRDAPSLPTSTLKLLDLLGSSTNPEATDTLINLLSSEHTKIAMASAESLGRYNRKSAIVDLQLQIERPDYKSSYAFRFSLLKSIAQIRTAETVDFLSVTLPTLDGQLQHQVATFLEQVDASYFRGNKEKFEAWKTNVWEPLLASGFSDAQPGTARSYRSERYRRATYYGMPIYARRVIFIIDRSPSMNELVDGQSRMRRAIIELSQAIDDLDPATDFNVIVFDGRVRTWHKKLLEATPANKQKAIKFVQKYYRTNLTNTYAALRVALRLDDNIEAIYMISDGEPTTGSVTDPAEIINDITHRNSFRHIALNTVGIALTGTAQSFMQELAVQNGGEYRDTE